MEQVTRAYLIGQYGKLIRSRWLIERIINDKSFNELSAVNYLSDKK